MSKYRGDPQRRAGILWFAGGLLWIWLLIPTPALAQDQVKPYVMLLFDTSRSMLWDICHQDASLTNGDNSNECPGTPISCADCPYFGCGDSIADDSRIFKVKKGAYNVVSAFGEVTFALSRFHQQPDLFICDAAVAQRAGGWNEVYCNFGSPEMGVGGNQADVLVDFADDSSQAILSWINNCDDYPGPGDCTYGANPGAGTPPTGCSLCSDCGGGCDMEIRAAGMTPIAGALYDLRTTYFPTVLANDPKKDCRPYTVILLTDGQNTCKGDPFVEAANLFSNPDKSIPVHAVGFGDASLKTYLDLLALEGGTGSAVVVDNEVSLALAMALIISESIPREICNGIDDDCDDQCDESFPDVAVSGPGCTNQRPALPCTVGLGICQRTGEYVCTADGSDSECSVTAGTADPAGEICGNGLDDDCNGLADEGCPDPPVPWPEICDGKDNDLDGVIDEDFISTTCGSDIGECQSGATDCVVGDVLCVDSIPPAPEICDNKDNDCDTIVDSFIRACYPSGDGNGCDLASGSCQGVCAIGSEVCTEGSWGTCLGARGPSGEICNGLDDDCDGEVDEGVSNSCTDFGTCTPYTSCSVCPPTPDEICDGLDNDCNDQIDDDPLLVGTACGTTVGECTKGTWGCDAGELVCTGGSQPTAEVCDNKDNDCNGIIDDNIPGMGELCGEDTGACTQGIDTCIGGEVICLGGVGPVTEICDGQDNDCNGDVDDGLQSVSCGSDVGECTKGTTLCVGGQVICDGSTDPTSELCDGLDNDCNGVADDYPVDEGTPCGDGTGECVQGTSQCVSGGLVCVGEQGPTPEVCDGRDNDCNELVDDNIPGTGPECGIDVGECQKGNLGCVLTPTAGWTIACAGGQGPVTEICDGLDNDCDTEIDEDYPEQGSSCGVNLGECKAGTYTCENGVLICDGEVGGSDEVCDGKDNDCNGTIDDDTLDEGAPCGTDVGECEKGTTVCSGGQLLCTGGKQPTDEVCDCLDNDCNGTADDLAQCPGSSDCIDCQCLVPCEEEKEFLCPGGFRCVNSYCRPDTCADVQCEPTQRCENGICVARCAGVKCGEHEACDPLTGLCVDDSCHAKGCPDHQVCVAYQCVDTPCPPGRCPEGQICHDGDCSDTCENTDCPPSHPCIRGSCSDHPCHGNACASGFVCEMVDGQPKCVSDPCRMVSCDPGQTCKKGQCVIHPCMLTRCPTGFQCFLTDTGEADCERIPGYPLPNTRQMLATGSGGLSCQVGSGNASPGGLPLLLGLLGLVVVGRRRKRWLGPLALAGLTILLLAGCQQDNYNRLFPPDVGLPDGMTDGLRDFITEGWIVESGACTPTGEEVCDEQDNDCNGTIDDVDPARLASDIEHCGACFNECSFPNAFARCTEGTCEMSECSPGWWPINGTVEDPCPYNCYITNGGVETCPDTEPNCVCDKLDNDCDGEIDEDFDLTTDVNNCGSCGHRCLFNNASGTCVDSQCKMDQCQDGFVDLNGNEDDGCEYKCPVYPPVSEECNGEDDDCDMEIDEDTPGSGQPCDTGLIGECQTGITQCQLLATVCVPVHPGTQEICDQKDNDCDGESDEDFDLTTNALHCGACNNACAFANAIPLCLASACTWEQCLPGHKDLNGIPDDGCEHTCDVWPATAEECNGLDDDCDTETDEGFDLTSNVMHCGQCNHPCIYPNAKGECLAGTCQMTDCDVNYHDIDMDDLSGCEYFCVETNNGIEICDGADNNCNGKIDDGYNTQTDPKNCGTCGVICAFNNAAASCVAGQCQIGACNDGYKNLDQLDLNGCEYECPLWPVQVGDDCDGVDSDCDGQLDEDFPSSTCGEGLGQCAQGSMVCVGGTEICQGASDPTTEICNNLDDDCDGETDEDFDKQNDPRHCGPECLSCSAAQATPNCTAGICGIAVCNTGWIDLNEDATDGCEYQCLFTGTELCDGLDNDCNGLVDALDPDMVELGGNPCAVLGACTGATASCHGEVGWICDYGPEVELQSCEADEECMYGFCSSDGVCPGEVSFEETRCDEVDNNCDGLVDETFTQKGQPCFDEDKMGICQGSGTWVCDTSGSETIQCKIGTPGLTPQDELCNGLDDDCDGLVDEDSDDAAGKGVVDSMVHIQREYQGQSYDFYVYTYEASRPDADQTTSGSISARACSKPGVLPWSDITYPQADDACAAAGKRLCSAAEWLMACSGAPDDPIGCRTIIGDGCDYPYGDTFAPTACNGKDFSASADEVLATGAATACTSPDGASDMSGNLKEWTADPRPPPPETVEGYTLRGGSFDNLSVALRCDFTFAVMPPDFHNSNIGFRCCSDSPP